MKLVLALTMALSLAASSFAAGADPSTQGTKKKNTPNNVNSTNKNANPGKSNNTNPTNNSKAANAKASSQQLLKLSQEGFSAMRAVRAARVAVFNGQPNVASEMLNKAKTNLKAAAKNAPWYVMDAEVTVNGKVAAEETAVGKMNWIPIDGQVTLGDTLVATPEKSNHIQKANQYLKNGQNQEAIAELKLAEIDVTCTRVLMPLTTTSQYVNEAADLVAHQKYYEANLALKNAEDSLVVKTTGLVEMPQVNTKTNPTKVN